MLLKSSLKFAPLGYLLPSTFILYQSYQGYSSLVDFDSVYTLLLFHPLHFRYSPQNILLLIDAVPKIACSILCIPFAISLMYFLLYTVAVYLQIEGVALISTGVCDHFPHDLPVFLLRYYGISFEQVPLS